MNKFLLAALFATATVCAADMNIVYIRPEEIFNGCQKAQDKIEDLQDRAEEHKKKFDEKRRDLQKKVAEFEKQDQAKMLSDEAKKEKVEKLAKLEQELMMMQQSVQEMGAREMQALQEEILDTIKRIAKKIAKEKGYKMVLMGGVIYADDNMDITDEVLRALNAEYKEEKKKAEQKAKDKAAKVAKKE